ncbi:MAG: hypothetical protein PHV37_01735 [Candidatus Gastranaerophilales bacterium]|nr:hypothetical protein [Candidatus Gastranaerophilales bacterium]
MLSLKFGNVINIDDYGRVRVNIPDMDNFETDYLPVIKQKSKNDKDGNFLDIDEEVSLIYDDETDDGVVLGAVNTDSSPLAIFDRNKKYFTFSDGTHIEYDKSTHHLKADVKGSAEIIATNVNITGNLIVTGDVTAAGISLKNHLHGNGNNGADTTPPKV